MRRYNSRNRQLSKQFDRLRNAADDPKRCAYYDKNREHFLRQARWRGNTDAVASAKRRHQAALKSWQTRRARADNQLSPPEKVLMHLAEGLTPAQIAARLKLLEKTVRTYIYQADKPSKSERTSLANIIVAKKAKLAAARAAIEQEFSRRRRHSFMRRKFECAMNATRNDALAAAKPTLVITRLDRALERLAKMRQTLLDDPYLDTFAKAARAYRQAERLRQDADP